MFYERTHEQLNASLKKLFACAHEDKPGSFGYALHHDELVYLNDLLARHQAITAERDRLAAEIAELRKEADEMAAEIVAAHFANATLDALREVVPIDVTGWATDEVVAAFFKSQHKLYPQPKETTDD